MISSQYGLQRNPFRGAPDPASFFPSARHRRAVELVSRTITERAGLVLVMGAIGLGKTTVCRTVQERHRGEFVTGYLGNPFLSADEFGEQILHEFGQEGGTGSSGEVVRALRGFLKRHFRERRPVVLFIDEAHLLGPDVLEFLLILTNVQEKGEHLLQVVLSGQSEFQETLRRPRFSSLNQRLGNRIELRPLSRRETVQYVEHRLRLAGARKKVFSRAGLEVIWKVTRGTPRLVNQVCDHLLRRKEGTSGRIGRRDVARLAGDPVFSPLLFPGGRSVRGRWPLGAAVLAGTLLLATGARSPEFGPVQYDGTGGGNVSASVSMSGTMDSERVRQQVPAPEKTVAGSGPETAPADRKVETALSSMEARLAALHQSIEGLQDDIRDDGFAFDPAVDAPPQDSPDLTSAVVPSPSPRAEIDVRVGAIVWDDRPEGRMAVLDDRIVHEGDGFSGYRVTAINEHSVELEKGGETYVVGIVKKF
jgi:general secretion pathway protein A